MKGRIAWKEGELCYIEWRRPYCQERDPLVRSRNNLKGETAMKILFVTSECAPFSKSGGLADVAFSLPPALADSGNEIAVITPLYQCVKENFGSALKTVWTGSIALGGCERYCGLLRGENHGVTMWFVDNEEFFLRPRLYGYDDDKLRFAWFSRAVIDLLHQLDFMPDILHCNDWESALSVIYLKNDQVTREDLRKIKSVYTIHNIAYQGQFAANELEDTFALPGGWYQGGLGFEYEGRHDINLMKGAMLMADAVSTVSPTYARELHFPAFGMGLQGVADIIEGKLFGIMNGIDMDHYDPEKDKRLPYAFSVKNMTGKARCKKQLQRKFGLEEEPRFPLFCSVARLVEQKGIELIKELLPRLMELGIQLIIYGQGDQSYIDYFNECVKLWPGQLGFSSDYNENTASEVFAGSDFYLMPSRFEPCGLSQMMAMRYGTVPIVHETGGLKDSVRPYSEFDGIGDGFSFSSYQSKDLLLAIMAALRVYLSDEKTFALLRRRCMEKDFSWKRSAEQYERMYGSIFEGELNAVIPFEEAFDTLKEIYAKLIAKNQSRFRDSFPDKYHRVVQIHMTGRASGYFYLEFINHDGAESFNMEPYTYIGADGYITASYDNLLGMADGTVDPDRLFRNGQLKVEGNIAKSADLRMLLKIPESNKTTMLFPGI